jgi:arylsulfatase A-like enzyme
VAGVRDLTSVALVLLLAVTACGGTDSGGAVSAPRPDVVLIVIDTLRADHLGSHGYPRDTTPNIDALAAESTRYARAYSHAPWTTPAVAALMTSRYPSAFGITSVQSRLPDEATLLPELLLDAGYRTAAFVSHSFVSAKWGFSQGFERFDESNVKGHMATTSPDISELAIAWLQEQRGEEPVFLFLHYFDPHFGYIDQPDFPFGGRAPDYEGPVRSGSFPGMHAKEKQQLSPADIHELRRQYDSEIALTDREIGRVLDALREAGRYESAVVVLTGDHGEEFFDHGSLDHTKTLYDELVHVPLLMKLPGRPAGVIETPVAHVDLLPTLTDWLDLELPPGARGRSLLEVEDAESRPVFLETKRLRRLRGVVLNDEKLILDLASGETQLFDLASDPAEQTDLSQERPDRVRTLRALIEAWDGGAATVAVPPLELDEEERERLKALGYL